MSERPPAQTRPVRRKRHDPYQEPTGRKRTAVWLWRAALLLLMMVLCLSATFIFYIRWRDTNLQRVQIEGVNPNLSVPERFYLQNYISSRAEQLAAPIGSGDADVPFTIASGQTGNEIALNLASAGLLPDTELFLNYLRYFGLDSQLEAGDFLLSPNWTMPELAVALTNAQARTITLRFIEGWRLEEMAHYLREIRPAAIDADEFLRLTQRQTPFDLAPYDFLASLPATTSLEGFLFPDTYQIPVTADAAYLVDLMLRNFGQQVTPTLRQAFGAQGLGLPQAVALASIVQREAVLADERPLIAGVFLNRLNIDMLLQADPTVQYGLGFQADSQTWWKSPLFLSDLEFDSAYNTYLYAGLPPTPIANPGLSALTAVAYPEASDFIFFVANCDGTAVGSHIFSVTFEEHLANVQRCS